MRKTLTLLALVPIIFGCSSVTKGDFTYVAGTVADLATTAVALDAGLQEGNPVLGESWEAIAANALLSAGLWWAVKKISKDWDPEIRARTLRVMGAVRFSAAAWNTKMIMDNDQ